MVAIKERIKHKLFTFYHKERLRDMEDSAKKNHMLYLQDLGDSELKIKSRLSNIIAEVGNSEKIDFDAKDRLRNVLLSVFMEKEPVSADLLKRWFKELMEKEPNLDKHKEKELNDFVKWFHYAKQKYNPIVFSALAFFKIMDLRIFEDANHRIAKTIMTKILVEKGYIPFIFFNKYDVGYKEHLRRASLKHNPFIFVSWFLETYGKFLREDLYKFFK